MKQWLEDFTKTLAADTMKPAHLKLAKGSLIEQAAIIKVAIENFTELFGHSLDGNEKKSQEERAAEKLIT